MKVIFENEGDIATQFMLSKKMVGFGSCFKFEPENGVLEISEQRRIKVTFDADRLGEFQEEFQCTLEVCNS